MMKNVNRSVSKTIPLIPANGVGVELGVWRGNSSEMFLEKCTKLHLVDSWSIEPYKDDSNNEWPSYENYLNRYARFCDGNTEEDFMRLYDEIFISVTEKFKDKPVNIYRMTTEKFFNEFKEKVNWVYVDASHSYDGCLFDLRKSLNIIKEDGIIFGDDFHFSKKGVIKAVKEFVKENGFFLMNFFSNQYLICKDREHFDRFYSYDVGKRGGIQKETTTLKKLTWD